MIGRSIVVGAIGLALLLGTMTTSAEIPPPTVTPTPSFDTSVTILPTNAPRIEVPGEQVLGGSSYVYSGPDGSRYHVYTQISLILPPPTPTPTPAPTPAPPPVVSADDDAFTYFGLWNLGQGTTQFPKYGLSDHYSDAAGAATGFMFTGTEVRIFGAIAAHHGIGTVRIDSGPAVDVDWYSPIRVEQAPVFYSGTLDPGVHRILITVGGRNNPASTGMVIAVDRADITNGTLIPPLTQ